jgi:putative copper resistance protein D
MLFFGVFAFDRFVTASILGGEKTEAANYWKSCVRLFSLFLLPIIFISGIVWFVLVAMAMSGQPPQLEILKTVWMQTQFGMVWKIRFITWIAATVTVAPFLFSKSQSPFQKGLIWLQLVFGGVLLGSLAWAGHGEEDSRWHLVADILHLLVAGLWPTGLLPFAMLLREFRRTSEPAIVLLIRRFSALSLLSVSLLSATGLINSWFLVGSFSNLFNQTYGRWLMVKIAFFCVAVAIGAVNLLRLKPRLSVESLQSQNAQMTAVQLQFNVQVELVLGIAIVIVVAILGILPPANH